MLSMIAYFLSYTYSFMKTTSTKDKHGTTRTQRKAAPLNLIDFDDSPAPPSASASASTSAPAPMSDLDALSSLSLGSGSTSYSNPLSSEPTSGSSSALSLDLFGSATPQSKPSTPLSWNTQSSQPNPMFSQFSMPQQTIPSQQGNYQPNYSQPQQQPTQQQKNGMAMNTLGGQNSQPAQTQQTKKPDPFEDLLL